MANLKIVCLYYHLSTVVCCASEKAHQVVCTHTKNDLQLPCDSIDFTLQVRWEVLGAEAKSLTHSTNRPNFSVWFFARSVKIYTRAWQYSFRSYDKVSHHHYEQLNQNVRVCVWEGTKFFLDWFNQSQFWRFFSLSLSLYCVLIVGNIEFFAKLIESKLTIWSHDTHTVKHTHRASVVC